MKDFIRETRAISHPVFHQSPTFFFFTLDPMLGSQLTLYFSEEINMKLLPIISLHYSANS